MNMKKFNYKKLVSNFILNFVMLTIIVTIIRIFLGGHETVYGILIRLALTTYFTIYKPLLYRSEKNIYE